MQKELEFHPYLPLNDKGKPYELNDLFDDQKWIAYMVLSKIHEWLTCEDYSIFEPLRCTVNGQAGTGKSVLLNTITTVVRKFTTCNNSCLVCAPSGTAAFNVNGSTIHSMTGMSENDEEATCCVLSQGKKESLTSKFKDCLVLIFDERSLIGTHLLGKAERIIDQVAFEGLGSKTGHSWGGIPVVLIAGDDYQLGGMGEVAHDLLPPFNTFKSNKSIMRGRTLFRELSNAVFKFQKVPFLLMLTS